MNQYGQVYSPAAFQSQPSLPIHELPQHPEINSLPARPTQQIPYSRSYDLAQESYNHNRNAIPGLGLSFTGQPVLTRPSAENEAATLPDLGLQALPAAVNQAANNLNRDAANLAWVPPADADLSEGELEDLYEPFDDEVEPTNLSVDNAGLCSRPHRHFSVLICKLQERGASYSPRLSSVGDMQDEPLAESTSIVTSAVNGSSTSVNEHATELSPAETVDKARRDARDAVLSLNLLHVKHDTYRHNGIERSILESLFQELGLALDWPIEEERAPAIEQSQASANITPASQSTTQRISKPVSLAETPKAGKETGSAAKDKSEERKDRIARLLAAKNSRQTSTVQPVAAPAPVEPLLPPPPPVKKSLEKSKLLQQKMEALRKAREAKAETSAQIEFSLTPNTRAKNDSALDLPLDTASPVVINSAAVEASDEQLPQGHSTREPEPLLPPPAVSGLQVPRGKRPVASDFDPLPQAKRPFSQTQSARPFRIEVSDDEDDSDDDTEMAIESPEQRPSVLSRQATGETALRSYPPLSDLPNRSYSSPIASGEKPAQSPGKEDLSRMHKDIEDMKRRIAEAEARKKARLSRQGTPSQSQTSSRSDLPVDLSESTTKSAHEIIPAAGTGSKAPEISSPGEAANSLESGIPRRRTLSRSMSRSTNERLAAIEAERKRKELKMRILQAQIAQMEREMEASRQEESELRERDDPEFSEGNHALPDHEMANVVMQLPSVYDARSETMRTDEPAVEISAAGEVSHPDTTENSTRVDTSRPHNAIDHSAQTPPIQIQRNDDDNVVDKLKGADSSLAPPPAPALDPATNTSRNAGLRERASDGDDIAMDDLATQGSESSDEGTSSSGVSEDSEGDEASASEGPGSPDTTNEVAMEESTREHTPSVRDNLSSPGSSHSPPSAKDDNTGESMVQVQAAADSDQVDDEDEVDHRS